MMHGFCKADVCLGLDHAIFLWRIYLPRKDCVKLEFINLNDSCTNCTNPDLENGYLMNRSRKICNVERMMGMFCKMGGVYGQEMDIDRVFSAICISWLYQSQRMH